MKRGNNPQGMADAIEEIRIAEGHMLSAHFHLLPNIRQDDLRLYDPKSPLIYGHNRTMPALSCCARISGAISDHTTGDRPGGYSAASGNGRSTCDLRRSGFLQWHPPCPEDCYRASSGISRFNL